MWILAAVLSSFFAGITAVLAKCGIRKTDSDVATALRTVIVLAFSWIMVFIVGSQSEIGSIRLKSLIFLILSGAATGASWLCYFKALSLGDVSKVAPIDKSSTVLTVLLAIIFFSETEDLGCKIAGMILLSAGIFFITERRGARADDSGNRKWLVYALLSAVFAALTSVLAKVGVSDVESNLATAIRTIVVLIMAFVVVRVKGKKMSIPDVRESLFIMLSGIATGASWLCYYYAIKNGDVSIVVPIDKMNIIVTAVFSYIFLKERVTKRYVTGLAVMLAGTLIMAL